MSNVPWGPMDRKALAAAITLARGQYGFITWQQALQAGSRRA